MNNHTSEPMRISNNRVRDLIAVAYHLRDGIEVCVPKEHSALELFLCEKGVSIRFLDELFKKIETEGDASIEAIYAILKVETEEEAE